MGGASRADRYRLLVGESGVEALGPGSGSLPDDYVGDVGVENELGQETVLPLGFEEMPELSCGAFLIVVAVADGYERRVPRPLVRIEPRTRHRVLTGPVEVEHRPGLTNEHVFIHPLSHALVLPLSGVRRSRAAGSRLPSIMPPWL